MNLDLKERDQGRQQGKRLRLCMFHPTCEMWTRRIQIINFKREFIYKRQQKYGNNIYPKTYIIWLSSRHYIQLTNVFRTVVHIDWFVEFPSNCKGVRCWRNENVFNRCHFG